ncbi:MAG: tripartite tricarboxylate transporter substrate binding protein [Pseudomonadota bacterium]|nr:tripartite tricarboxylate transporter substrate binding protein [Pseudomonadota bacterium]
MLRRVFLRGIGLAAMMLPACFEASAQTPRVITLVVPFTPGTGPDAIARIVGPRLGARLGASVVVENKAGASGNIGTDFVAKAKPDGSTLLATVNTFTITPALYKNLPYNPLADFAPIGKVAVSNIALVVNAAVPAPNFEALLALARARPGGLNYGSPGSGTPQHLAMEVLKKRYGLDILHVPYKGAAGANTDLLGGQIQMAMLPVHTALPFVKAGKLRMLAVSGDTRSTFAPDIPSLGELGAGNVDLSLYFWLAAPAGMPADQVAHLNRELVAVLAIPEVKEMFAAQGLIPDTGSPAQIADTIRRDIERWKRFVAEQNITVD